LPDLTGSAYRVTVPAPKDSFRLLTGKPKVYVKTAESGTRRAHGFCPECGTPIYATAVTDPQVYGVRARHCAPEGRLAATPAVMVPIRARVGDEYRVAAEKSERRNVTPMPRHSMRAPRRLDDPRPLFHFAFQECAEFCGVEPSGIEASRTSRAVKSGPRTIFRHSALSLATTASAVPAGANIPYHCAAS
jgi:hypothetical protein